MYSDCQTSSFNEECIIDINNQNNKDMIESSTFDTNISHSEDTGNNEKYLYSPYFTPEFIKESNGSIDNIIHSNNQKLETNSLLKDFIPFLQSVKNINLNYLTIGLTTLWGIKSLRTINKFLNLRYSDYFYQIRRAKSLSNRISAFKYLAVGGSILPVVSIFLYVINSKVDLFSPIRSSYQAKENTIRLIPFGTLLKIHHNFDIIRYHLREVIYIIKPRKDDLKNILRETNEEKKQILNNLLPKGKV